ncbi:MBL fold metallo-hydrolase [Nocardioides kongjuensis]|uniref:L-ascorbate metabolism protein UlaG (Beta-lactamase superfamily) n=1 Tax=Nocardioides kongjuensis TaxID=349522 RepID=A0A852R5U8_9ACTN|nr:L-ascorbate metabolism protein UlaG (beta-lactamase superfamily) [Nocardioides kongjuensis]
MALGLRLRLGRPEIGRYADRFGLPRSTREQGDGVGVTFLGVASLLIDDGSTAVLTDGFFSRPSLRRVALGTIAPDEARIDATLARAGIDRVDVVAPVHTHFDHVMDSAVVAQRTGARLVGGTSVAQVGQGGGLPDEQVEVVVPGAPMRVGGFRLTWVEGEHCPPDRYPGTITAPVVPPVRTEAYRCGEAWSILVEHDSGRTALVQGSAGFRPGALAGHRAEVAYLGIGQLGVQDRAYIEQYWAETVETVGARQVVLIHWDDFFRPLDKPLRALPYLGDDLDATMDVLTRLAGHQGVGLHFPSVWRREDPWALLG